MGALPTPKPLQNRQPPDPGPLITQTIHRSSTTFTTHVTLGRAPASAFETTTSYIPPPSATTPTPEPESQEGGAALSSGEVGAILGSIFVFTIAVLVVWHFLTQKPKESGPKDDDMRGFYRRREYESDTSSDFGSIRPSWGGWPGGGGGAYRNVRYARPMRPLPVDEVRVYQRPEVAYGNVRHVVRPPGRYYVSKG